MSSMDVIDQAALDRLQEWGGDRLLRQMVRLFLDNAPERLDQIREGFSDGDLEVVERAAHGLKSSAANLGAGEVAELAGRIEDAARSGSEVDVRSLLVPLEKAHDRAVERLGRVLEEDR